MAAMSGMQFGKALTDALGLTGLNPSRIEIVADVKATAFVVVHMPMLKEKLDAVLKILTDESVRKNIQVRVLQPGDLYVEGGTVNQVPPVPTPDKLRIGGQTADGKFANPYPPIELTDEYVTTPKVNKTPEFGPCYVDTHQATIHRRPSADAPVCCCGQYSFAASSFLFEGDEPVVVQRWE